MKVIAATGKNASGKDEFVERLFVRYGIRVFSTGDIGRALAKKEGLPATRQNLHAIAERQMTRHGQWFFPDAVIKKIKESQLAFSAVSGLRPFSDVMRFREVFGQDFILVHVLVSDDSTRFERARTRASERDPISFEEFLESDRKEELLFQISLTAAAADYVIKNDGTLEDFRRDIDDFAVTVLRIEDIA